MKLKTNIIRNNNHNQNNKMAIINTKISWKRKGNKGKKLKTI